MGKIVIASDIHGSAYYCEKLIEAYQNEEADKMLLLGDILYHGPRNELPKGYHPKEVIRMLNELQKDILCVRGNCDSEVDQMVLDFPIMAEYCILYQKEQMVFATHGHFYHEDALPKLHHGDILLHGHTHVPACKKYENYVYMNPGSVSIPKNGSWHGYMTWEKNCFQWKDLSGQCHLDYKEEMF